MDQMGKGTIYHTQRLGQIDKDGRNIFSHIPFPVLMELVEDKDTEQQHHGKTVHMIPHHYIGGKTGGQPDQEGYCPQEQTP